MDSQVEEPKESSICDRVPVSYKLNRRADTFTGVLPFVIGVLADLSGNPDEPLPRLRDRKFVKIDPDNFNAVLRGMKPRLAFRVDNQLTNDDTKLAVELRFHCIHDFGPERVVQQVEPLTRLLEVRSQLWALVAKMDGNDRLIERLQEILTNTELLKQVSEEARLETTGEGQRVLGGSPTAGRTARAQAVSTAGSQQEVTLLDHVITETHLDQDEEQRYQSRLQIATLVEEVMIGTVRVSKDLEATIRARIVNIDELLSRQLSEIMHAPEFQQLEASWRGLHYLVQQCKPHSHLHVKVLNVSKSDLLRDLERASEFDQSAAFKKIYEEEFGTFGGEPFGCLVGDYYFGLHPQDITILEKVSNIAAAAHTPFISGAAPTLLTLENWNQLNPRFNPDWFLTATSYIKWRSLCESIDGDFIFLTLPRLLARPRYGTGCLSMAAFEFQEEPSSAGRDTRVWFNASYALAAIIARTFQRSHWLAPIDGPCHGAILENSERVNQIDPSYSDHLTKWQDPPLSIEFAVHHSLAFRLKSIGLCAITKDESSSAIYFQDTRAVRWWRTVRNEGELSPALPVLLCANRFLYHFRCLCREIGPHHCENPELVLAYLNQWLKQYVQPDPCDAAERALKPLAEGKIEIPSLPPSGNEFSVRLSLKPAYQFHSPYQYVDYTARLLRITKGPSLQAEFVTAEVPMAAEVPMIVVIADLGGRPEGRRVPWINVEYFNPILKNHKPCIHTEVANVIEGKGSIAVDVEFNSLEDFEPERVGQQIEPLRELFVERARLVDLALYLNMDLDRDRSLGEQIKLPGAIPALISKLEAWFNAVEEGAGSPIDPDVIKVELGVLLPAAEGRLDKELRQVLPENLLTLHKYTSNHPNLVDGSGLASIEATVRKIDQTISGQLKCIFRLADFRKLEASWRGLYYFVKRLSTDQYSKTFALNFSKQELASYLKQPSYLLNKDILERLGWSEQYRERMNDIICLICDYTFDDTQADAEMLAGLAHIATAEGIPLIAAASSTLLNMNSWAHVSNGTKALETLTRAEYAAWRYFHQDEQARYVHLIFPPFQVRPAHRRQEGMISKFEFEEDDIGIEGDRLLRSNSAYVVAAELAILLNQRELYRDSMDEPFVAAVTVPNAEELLGPLASSFPERAIEELRRYGLIHLALRQIPIVIGPGRRADAQSDS